MNDYVLNDVQASIFSSSLIYSELRFICCPMGSDLYRFILIPLRGDIREETKQFQNLFDMAKEYK